MNITEFDFLDDSTEATTTRFVTFIGPSMRRFDLAVTTTNRFFGKKLVADMQTGVTAIIGPDDLAEEGYLEFAFRLNEEEAEEMRTFLQQVVDPVNFADI